MGNPATYIITTVVLLLLGLKLALHSVRHTPSDPPEPPIVPPKVPLVGHLLGIVKYDAEYLNIMISRTRLPIFTLKIFSTKLHIINSPDLVQAVFRNAKTISMDEIVLAASSRLFGTSKDRVEILKMRYPGTKESVIKKTHQGMHISMSPGHGLLEMNTRALNSFAVFLNEIDTEEKPVDLYAWLADCFTVASAEALYGPINPISEDKSLIQKLQDFEAGVGLLFVNILPHILAPKAHDARRTISASFKSYYDRCLYLSAGSLIRERHHNLLSGGLTSNDMKDWDVGILVAATMNSFAGMFWLISYLFSDHVLLADVRAEVLTIITTTIDDEGKRKICFDVPLLQKKCPLLVSAWKETMRMQNASVSRRVVDEETVLNDTYLLKKGSMVQIPVRGMHLSIEIWGPTAGEFDARRFLRGSNDSFSREQIKMQKQAFNPFGGGSVLCPGRHFATTEILGVAATIVLGYDLRMKDGGVLKAPAAKRQLLSVTILQPVGGLDILIKRRKEFEGVDWAFEVGGEVSSDDLAF